MNSTQGYIQVFLSQPNWNVLTWGVAFLAVVVSTFLKFPLSGTKKTIIPAKSKLYGQPVQSIKPTAVDPSFQWNKDPPLKSYPFKDAVYKLTMGIKTLEVQDWLLIEPTYLNRIENKSKIVHNCHEDYPKDKDTRSSSLFVTDEAIPAIREFYDIVMQYMCDKYPMYFKKVGNQYHNGITDKCYPVDNSTVEAITLEEYLVENIEEDFIILLKDPTREHEIDGTEYFFKGGVFAFAAGFDPKDRFNKPLSFVHHPIPGYPEKLKMSMNRFFNRLQPGQFVTRSNFSMQTHPKFYVDDANKGHNLPEGYVQEPLRIEELDFEKQVHYRSERQCLTKLPKSGAMVFTIRTYLLPLAEVKREGREVCDRLIGAIRGLPEDISQYKRADEWGPAVIEYLSVP
ncbi:uncharacterized protein SPAPADRAFT_58749 [Spathaspora passalidarum NRRL Y-27907]|uniref:HRQ family protein 2 n=1 Tax=Spathaspora passalidarum (strain NRRL Y-27907 / 11-Y1) TaxID=619300 RepID=G3AH83_SPAPN|nr:uncharacterized protein SPAPADRAFT_58749 [Spathaspora passalidarum NRRL Y-27907]EGW35513.1 hypothetical protein SPAPADRAFT_58749 [Spathaspora passalidarum NRRL Y-27907]